MDRGENSRRPAGFCSGCWDTMAPVGDVVICRRERMDTSERAALAHPAPSTTVMNTLFGSSRYSPNGGHSTNPCRAYSARAGAK